VKPLIASVNCVGQPVGTSAGTLVGSLNASDWVGRLRLRSFAIAIAIVMVSGV